MSELRELWAKRVRGWKSSGQTAQDYCAEEDYGAAELYRWSSRLQNGLPASGPVPARAVKLAKVVRVTSSRSVEVVRVRFDMDGAEDVAAVLREVFSEGRP